MKKLDFSSFFSCNSKESLIFNSCFYTAACFYISPPRRLNWRKTMGKKKEEKKRNNIEKEQALFLAGEKIDSKELLLNVITTLQKFCDDNILALKPLLDEVEENEAIKERIIHFVTISDLLDSIEQLTSVDLSKILEEKKKTVKKKK
ncbi:MAG: hypothetical protein J6L82_05485 [Alphaproteobacteria bacterium]|nr:hypothetical protein [Alphaproteobacteria bacterium]